MDQKMVSMTQKEILSNAKSVCHGLHALHLEHRNFILELMKENSDKTIKTDTDVDKRLQLIKLGLDEAQLMIAVSEFVQDVEARNLKLKTQIHSLYKESTWLREELNVTQAKLTTCEVKVSALEVENAQLKFMNTMKQYDEEGENLFTEESKPAPNEENGTVQLNVTSVAPQVHEKHTTNSDSSNGLLQQSTTSFLQQSTTTFEFPIRLKSLHYLVMDHASQGRYKIALPLCKRALKEIEDTNGRDHPDCATLLNILALLHRDQNKYEDAVNYLHEALAIRERIFGENHHMVAATLNNLAVLHGRKGKYADAEPLFKRALDIKEHVLGTDHPDVAKQLNNLAVVCQNQEKYDDVNCYYNRALDIYLSKLPPDDINIGKMRINFAASYFKQGKYEEAEKLYKQVLSTAHEKEFADDSKSIWELAEEREVDNKENITPSLTNMLEYDWDRIDSPIVTMAVKKLCDLYCMKGKNQAAHMLDSYIVAANKDRESTMNEVKKMSGLGLDKTMSDTLESSDENMCTSDICISSTMIEGGTDN